MEDLKRKSERTHSTNALRREQGPNSVSGEFAKETLDDIDSGQLHVADYFRVTSDSIQNFL